MPELVFMLAVWGKKYINNFFDFSLRTLLAPGNLPALSQAYPCSFIFLTDSKDIPFFKNQTLFPLLSRHCHIEFVDITDLIFNGNYSATLTLAYERGMRTRGKKMCETYFFYLVSDYLIANHSLKNITYYIEKGFHAITSGNFLIVEEYAAKHFKQMIEKHPEGLLALNARELLALSFPYLHPVSKAQTITQPYIHATHANRLFWQVDDETLVGRFYLRHMLCIKPELENFLIGSSCDYSFISEMCPSGNVAHITDSDDYCVVEMAPYDYEERWIKIGKYEKQALAKQLSLWTTEEHRKNAHIPVVFHAKIIPENTQKTIEASKDLITTLEPLLSQPPKPTRRHPFWISCVNSILAFILKCEEREKFFSNNYFAGIIDSPTFYPVLQEADDDRFILKADEVPLKEKKRTKLGKKLLGISPNTSIWHLGWIDDFFCKRKISEILKHNQPTVFIVREPIKEMIEWIEEKYPNICTFLFYDLLVRQPLEKQKSFFYQKQQAIIWLSGVDFFILSEAVRQCASNLPEKSSIHLYIRNAEIWSKKRYLKRLAICMADLETLKIYCKNVVFYNSFSRKIFSLRSFQFFEWLQRKKLKLLQQMIAVVGLIIINGCNVIANLASIVGRRLCKKCTSTYLMFRKE